MIKKWMSMILAVVLVLSCFPVYAIAEEVEGSYDPKESASFDALENEENIDSPVVLEEGTDVGSFKAIIMQGNTASASDCRTFMEGLKYKGNAYNKLELKGWSTTSDDPDFNRVTENQFKSMWAYDVAYYSGHGGRKNQLGYYPIINYKPSKLENDHGESNPINVASALGVQTSNWADTCYLDATDPLKVLVLASCYQLDTSIVKYYARLMKASNIRAIAGYHDIAPARGDDIIATDFIDYAAAGNSVWYSWQHANTGKNWAVLVYQNQGNQYYRLPGFPGKRYNDPVKNTVYRYASFLSNPGAVATSLEPTLKEQIEDLPLTVVTGEARSRLAMPDNLREIVCSEISVMDDDTLVRDYISKHISADATLDKICVQHYVSREEVNEEAGLLSDTETIVERTYDYFDTYRGIKIADSFIGASIDCEGIKNTLDERKVVVASGDSLNQSTRSISLITEDEAIEIARAEDNCCDDFTLLDVELAYAPTENGVHVLCYEITSSHGFCYVDVQSGDIITIA